MAALTLILLSPFCWSANGFDIFDCKRKSNYKTSKTELKLDGQNKFYYIMDAQIVNTFVNAADELIQR